jgi:tetratricopeptide (TPR) repeat protein
MENIKNMVVRFCVASAKHLDLGLTTAQLRCLLKECLEMLVGDKKTEMMAYLNLGMSYMSMEQYDDAVLYSKKCIDLAKIVGDKNAEMKAYLNLGATYYSMEQYDDAVLYSKKFIDLSDLAKIVGEKHDEMAACIILGKTYLLRKQYDDAVLYNKKCIDLVKETKEKSKEVRV